MLLQPVMSLLVKQAALRASKLATNKTKMKGCVFSFADASCSWTQLFQVAAFFF